MTGGSSLGSLLAAAALGSVRVVGDPAVHVEDVTHDSRRVRPGTLFAALRGEHADGHAFAGEAVAAGAPAVLVEHEIPGLRAVQVVVPDTRRALGPLASAIHGHPSRELTVVGVTGTNGKTTVTHVLATVLEASGWPTGLLGTLSGRFTTPEAPDLQAALAAFRDQGMRAVAMEVSSHALALHRVDGTRVALAVFTNLSRDHLDFHGTMERYFAAKARLFQPGMAEQAVVCTDDAYGRLLLDGARIPTVGFGISDAQELTVGPLESTFRWRGRPVRLPLGGRFNVVNALAAATAAAQLGVPEDMVVAGLGAVAPVPGRFEPVRAGQPFEVLVDYAHTPDGLEAVLRAAREVAAGHRVLVVFGCGGDRDRTKRPMMGETAARLADVVVVTSDNPRSEDPAAIIEDVRRGIPPGSPASVAVEPDRRAALALALGRARPGDVVIVAGKGHETTQTIGDRVVPFDDRQVVRELLEAGG